MLSLHDLARCGSSSLALAAVLASPAAYGDNTQPRVFRANPTAVCQSALPAYEAGIRKRPLAVQNEGTTPVFVTCSFISQGGAAANVANPTSVQVYFGSMVGGDRYITCTGVSGFYTGQHNHYITKTTLVPSYLLGAITWEAPDFGENMNTLPSGLFSISCLLPPGTGVADTRVSFKENIGN